MGTRGGSALNAANSGWGGVGTTVGRNPTTGSTTASLVGTTALIGSPRGGAFLGKTSTAGPLRGLAPNPSVVRSKPRLLVRDVAMSRLALVDLLDRKDGLAGGDPLRAQGRDLQLIGNCRVPIGTHLGYDEYCLLTHQRVAAVTSFPETILAQRLRTKNN